MSVQKSRSLVVIAAAKISDDCEQWVEVMPSAEKVRNGRFYSTVTRADLDTYAASIESQPGLIHIDYDHEGATGGSTIAAGWFTGETKTVSRGEANPLGDTQDRDSLWAVVKWTPQARQEILDGRFKRISAEYSFLEKDKKTGLMTKAGEMIAATLTNRPFFRELVPLASDEGFLEEADLALLERVADEGFRQVCTAALKAFDGTTREQMLAYLNTIGPEAEPTERNEMSDLKMIATELGLAEDATEEQVIAAVKAAKQLDVPADAVVLTKKEKDDLVAGAAAGLVATTKLEALEVKTILDDAVRERQLTVAQRPGYEALAAVDLDAFKETIEKLPKGVFSLAAVGNGGDNDGDDPDAIPDAEPVTVEGTAVAVDQDSHRLHVRAMKHLAEQKITRPTQDEYTDALAAVAETAAA